MPHMPFNARLTRVLELFEVDLVSNERLDLPLASFHPREESALCSSLALILEEIGLPPECTICDVERITVLVRRREGCTHSDILKLYRFHPPARMVGYEPVVLYSHGGTIRADPTLHSVYFPALALLLARRGMNCHFVAVDHRGAHCHADKTHFCIEDRVHDLVLAYGGFASGVFGSSCDVSRGPLFMIGNSMGGHVVAVTTELLKARGIALVSPGAFSKEAHFARFGPDFSHEVRKPGSWQTSPAFSALAGYLESGGSAILRASAFDDVIPNELTNRYAKCINESQNSFNEVAIAPVDHRMMVADDVTRVADFIQRLSMPTYYSHREVD